MSVNESELELDLDENPADDDTFKILVATDIHLGYAEKNSIRGQDSFVTFEEILQLAVKNDVDFLLLGGDLFHDSKPSPYCVYKCLELLRTYCLGDKAVSFEFLSDQSRNFQNQKNPIVNYEDPNLNISLPVFSIHGNHDDPTGQKLVSALDVISATGLVNYFGRSNELSQIEIRPIVLQKGISKLALYGLSHIKDERLGRLFREKKVHIKQPEGDDMFNLLVLHQNRVARGVKNFIPQTAFPEFLHLLIWGHEHDCRIEPENVGNDVFISQPGSSVATSLAAGEAIPKKVGLLYVYKQQFKMVALPLTTVRPFVIDEMLLENTNSERFNIEKPTDQAIEQVKQKIYDMIEIANSQHLDSNREPLLPLLRLKVFYYTEQQQFNAVRIGMQFANKVANSDDIIKFFSAATREKRSKTASFMEDEYERIEKVGEWVQSAEDIVLRFFEENTDAMSVLSAKGLTEAVSRFTKVGDSDTLPLIIENQFSETVNHLLNMDPDLDNMEAAIEACRLERQNPDQVQAAAAAVEEIVNRKPTKQRNSSRAIFSSDDDDEVLPVGRKTKAAPKGRSSHDDLMTIFDSDDDTPLNERTTRGSRASTSRTSNTSTRSRGSRARGASTRGKRGQKTTLHSFMN